MAAEELEQLDQIMNPSAFAETEILLADNTKDTLVATATPQSNLSDTFDFVTSLGESEEESEAQPEAQPEKQDSE